MQSYFLRLHKAMLSSDSWDKMESVTVQKRPAEHYFPEVLFTML